MTVQAGPTDKRYAANGVTTTFAIPFLIIQPGDLQVFLNGVLTTSGFTLVGVGDPTSTIIFDTAPTGDLYLVLNVPFERLFDYQENGDFLARTVNLDFDRIWQALKQLFRYSGRALTLGENDIDGQGWYRAKGNGIRDLEDPVEDQDAATKNWSKLYVGSVLQTGQGPINNAANVAYVDGDGNVITVQKGIKKQFSSVAKARLTPGDFDGQQASLLGYYSDFNGYGGGDLYWSALSTAADDSGTTFAVAGIPVGRWKRASVSELNVYHWGAKNGTESSDAIQRACDWVRSSGFPGDVDLGGNGFFFANKPIRGPFNCGVTGNAIIRAQAPFTPVTFDIDGGGTLTAAPILYFVDTLGTTNPYKVGAVSGSRRNSVHIAKTITLDCDDIAGFGVFMDNYIDCKINCRIQDPTKWGIWMYFYCWGSKIGSYITGPAEGGLWLGDGCNGVNIDHMKVWGDNKTPSVAGLLIDGNNNGLSCDGTFIEKVAIGALLRNTCGPIDLSGIDFEIITGNTIRCEGASTSGRLMGPVTVTGCFLETSSPTAALIYADNTAVIARGNRMRNAAKAYEVIGNGYIADENNTYTSVSQVGSNRVLRKGVVGRSLYDHNYSQASLSLETMREMYNYSYTYAPALVTSGLSFSHGITDAGAQRMVASSTWFVCDMLGGSENNRCGVSLAYTGGGTNKRFVPIDDNLTDCGFTGMRWRTVYAGSGAISTSDAREKTEVRGLSNAEIGAAKELAKEIGAFKFLAAVAEKGDDARDHIGMTVQRAIEVMEAHGLNPLSYSFICFDQWDAQSEQLSEDGSVVMPAIEAGELYSFRMDGLLAFVAAGLEARLSALEASINTV